MEASKPQALEIVKSIEFVLAITGIVGLSVSVLLYIAVSRDLQLMVWEKSEKVYPTSLTQNMPLPLRYADVDAKDVRFTTLTIMNVGSEYVGEQSQTWQLDLSFPEAELVSLVGTPSVIPNSTVWSVGESKRPNIVSLTLGVLEPRSEIVLHAIIINPKKSARFEASSGLEGLPRIIAGGSLWGQFASRFLPLTILTSLVCVGFFGYRDYVESSHKGWRKALTIIKLVVLVVLGGGFFGVVFAALFGWIASGIFLAGPFFESIVQWFS